tara:strand:+ start:55 stop:165 length:111 start_codon:yes stop_codon:yes gene_type:complete
LLEVEQVVTKEVAVEEQEVTVLLVMALLHYREQYKN